MSINENPQLKAVLRVENLNKSFLLERSFWRRQRDWFERRKGRRLQALNQVNFSVFEEEVLGILGESGSGKTTLARVLMGLIPSDSGQAFLFGDPLFGCSRTQHLENLRKMQIVFQDPFSSLDPRMTVRQILSEPLQIHASIPKSEWEEKLLHGVQEVGLEHDVLDRYPSEFSGGQRQRVGICRALILEPLLLIADEAVSALDVSVQAQILELLGNLRINKKFSLIFISHDVAVVRQLSDRILVLFQGNLVETMPADCLLKDACHPYTKKLLGAALRLREGVHFSSEPREKLSESFGCPFQPQCLERGEDCREKPRTYLLHNRHEVACWRFISHSSRESG